MMKKYAVVGTGAIGSLLGGYLSHAGYDVTMVPTFSREKVNTLQRSGLWMGSLDPNDDTKFHTDIKAKFIDDLGEERFDVVLLAVKSNDLVPATKKIALHLAQNGFVVTFQNGINEEFLIPIVGPHGVVAGSSFAGGHLEDDGHMYSHEGFFVIGELDGSVTPRVTELAEVLNCCKHTKVSNHIRAYQWEKMGRVCLSVPCACVSGLYLGDVFMEPRLQKLFAHLALEVMAVAEADGCLMDTLEGKSRQEWRDVAVGKLTGLENRDDGAWPPGIVDAYTADIQRGRPLEIVNTNGAVSRLGRRYEVNTPANDLIVQCVLDIRDGKATRGFHLVNHILNQV